MNKITKDLIDKWEAAASVAAQYEHEINNRIDYIVKFLFETFNQKLSTWYWYGAEEGSMGEIKLSSGDSTVSGIVTEGKSRFSSFKNIDLILKDGSKWQFNGDFPSRWLFEDFEQEVIDGKKKFEDAQIEKKRLAKEKALQEKKRSRSFSYSR